jgi:hypothetical protein
MSACKICLYESANLYSILRLLAVCNRKCGEGFAWFKFIESVNHLASAKLLKKLISLRNMLHFNVLFLFCNLQRAVVLVSWVCTLTIHARSVIKTWLVYPYFCILHGLKDTVILL